MLKLELLIHKMRSSSKVIQVITFICLRVDEDK